VWLEGDDDPAATFKAAWANAKATHEELGVSLRWAVLATSEGLKLELQALPAPASTLNRDPRLSNDACPAISLGSYQVEFEMETVAPLDGPVPVLFAKHPERARASLEQDPTRILKGKKELKQNFSRLFSASHENKENFCIGTCGCLINFKSDGKSYPQFELLK